MKRISFLLAVTLLLVSCANVNHTHVFTHHDRVEPTCTEEGVMEYNHCEECGRDFDINGKEIHDTTLQPLGHHEVEILYAPPSVYYEGHTTGKYCDRCDEVLVPSVPIEKLKTDGAHKIRFEKHDNAEMVVYDCNDFDRPYVTDIAYSYKEIGYDISSSYDGCLYFTVDLEEGYEVAKVVFIGNAVLIQPDEVGRGDNTYKLTNIDSDISVKVITRQNLLRLDKFRSNVLEDGTISFWWDYVHEELLDHIEISVSKEGVPLISNENHGKATSFTYRMEAQEEQYRFRFAPIYSNGTVGAAEEMTRINCSDYLRDLKFPMIKITTMDYELPTCERSLTYDGEARGLANIKELQASVQIFDKNQKVVYQTESRPTYYGGATVRIRGNGGGMNLKCAYRINLTEKADLLAPFLGRSGMEYASKKWNLIFYSDSCRNAVGFNVSKLVQPEWSVAYQYVVLIINGNYLGSFALSEAIERGNVSGDKQGRIAIGEFGYIIETDAYYWNNIVYFPTERYRFAYCFTFKYPTDIIRGEERFRYIERYINNFEYRLLRHDPTCLDYIDVESFARWLLTHDFLVALDCYGSNIYYTKYDDTSESKLKMTAIWDIDSILYQYNSFARQRTSANSYFPFLLQYDGFVKVWKKLFYEYVDKVIPVVEETYTNFDKEFNKVLTIEMKRWKSCVSSSIEAERDYNIDWFTKHIAWMKNNVGPLED